tara:strand:- start:43 stop:204 length:162 start_codon:yes stop_codon:yes gene_type:complete
MQDTKPANAKLFIIAGAIIKREIYFLIGLIIKSEILEGFVSHSLLEKLSHKQL